MIKVKNIFKKKDPERYRILVSDNKWDSSAGSIIELIEVYFKKYGFEFIVIDDEEKSFMKRFFNYEIEISYEDKDYVERLLRMFRIGGLTVNQYERWLKTERIRRKTLNI